jgi:hypothetical protein
MAVVTFGEGYHNFHHEFQHDYRNGVKPWQFDPTKWIIWTLSKVGLAKKLRTVPSRKSSLAELAEAQRRIETHLESQSLTAAARAYITSAYERLQATANEWAEFKTAQIEITREMLAELSARSATQSPASSCATSRRAPSPRLELVWVDPPRVRRITTSDERSIRVTVRATRGRAPSRASRIPS